MSAPTSEPIRTFEVEIQIVYTQRRTVRARTLSGARAAARAGAEADFTGATIQVGHPEEKGRAER